MLAGQMDCLKALFAALTTHEQVAHAIELTAKLDDACRNALSPILADKVRELGGVEKQPEN